MCDSSDGVNQRKEKGSGPGKGKGKCAACGSNTHLRSSHRECPFNKSHANKEPHSDHDDELIAYSESDEAMSDRDSLESGEDISDSDSSDSVIITCTCGVEGRAHKRDCPLSSRNRMSGHTLFPATIQPEAQAAPRKLETENVSLPHGIKKLKPEMNIGDYVCRSIHGFHILCRIVGEFAGRYQLYCAKGVLNTSFSCTELIPLTGCSPAKSS